MHMPTDIAVDQTGRAYVADGSNDRILRFGADGRFESSLTTPGGEKLDQPIGVAVDARNRLWIADTAHHRLLIVTSDGALVETIALPERDHPCDPTDLATTPDGKRAYVVDNENHRLLVRRTPDAGWTALGEFGRAVGQLQWPFMIGLGPSGDAFVTEGVVGRVQRLSSNNKWTRSIGGRGVQLGHLYRPKGVVVDRRGRCYISDSTLGVVQVFGPDGQIEGVLTGVDGQPLRFDHPMGLSLGPAGRLHVVELRAHRVAVVAIQSAVTTRPTPRIDGTSEETRP